MRSITQLSWKKLVLVITFFLAGCNDLIIKDDGHVTVGLDDCEGVAFQILVKQAGKPSTSTVVKVDDGELAFDVKKAGYDFAKDITIEAMAVGPGAGDCGIQGVRVFNGKAEPTGIKDHKVSLGDFKKR